MKFYRDSIGRPRNVDTHQFVRKAELAGAQEVPRPLRASEIVAAARAVEPPPPPPPSVAAPPVAEAVAAPPAVAVDFPPPAVEPSGVAALVDADELRAAVAKAGATGPAPLALPADAGGERGDDDDADDAAAD